MGTSIVSSTIFVVISRPPNICPNLFFRCYSNRSYSPLLHSTFTMTALKVQFQLKINSYCQCDKTMIDKNVEKDKLLNYMMQDLLSPFLCSLMFCVTNSVTIKYSLQIINKFKLKHLKMFHLNLRTSLQVRPIQGMGSNIIIQCNSSLLLEPFLTPQICFKESTQVSIS